MGLVGPLPLQRLGAVVRQRRSTRRGATYNGGSRYLPKTDGRRNDCFERLFLTVSPRFEEVLPNVPNPQSPWMHVAGERLWRAHGASRSRARLRPVEAGRPLRHDASRRSPTTRPAGATAARASRFARGPRRAKAATQAQADYARKIRALGFRYGIYNNYTDFAPVNEYWNEDLRDAAADGQWQTAWARCYNPKPARAVEFEARLAPIIQQKFQLDTAYCDVHTAVTPWDYCDFDARVPGAGTFAATFYAYGEIMLHQKKTWNGPVYSEGNNHWYYCGLTDGNYGQDQAARLAENPWLVDFDLRKLHPLCCNFGMGNLGMFFGRGAGLRQHARGAASARLDRFLAATLAFGHTGFLVLEGGMANAVRSYFSLQQVHARYAQAAAAEIRYADAKGDCWTRAAVAGGAFRRSQVVTRYDNGLEVWVNGHPQRDRKTPHGRAAAQRLVRPRHQGGRVDGVERVVDGQPRRLRRVAGLSLRRRARPFPALRQAGLRRSAGRASADGAAEMEVIPVADARGSACAGRPGGSGGRGAGRERQADWARPRPGSAAAWCSSSPSPARSAIVDARARGRVALQCDRTRSCPARIVTVVGRERHIWVGPGRRGRRAASSGNSSKGRGSISLVQPLVDAHARTAQHVPGSDWSRTPRSGGSGSHLRRAARTVQLCPAASAVEFPCSMPREEIRAGAAARGARSGRSATQRTWWLKAEEAVRHAGAIHARDTLHGQRVRGRRRAGRSTDRGSPGPLEEMACGDQAQAGLFMHPPYRAAVGQSFALFGPVRCLPRRRPRFAARSANATAATRATGFCFRQPWSTAEGQETVAAEKQWIEHAWTPLEADLSRWRGQRHPDQADRRRGPRRQFVGRLGLLGRHAARNGLARAHGHGPRPACFAGPRVNGIGRPWIELELPDGQKWSSQVKTTVYTQPPEWLYREGIGVPFSERITVPLRFRPGETPRAPSHGRAVADSAAFSSRISCPAPFGSMPPRNSANSAQGQAPYQLSSYCSATTPRSSGTKLLTRS